MKALLCKQFGAPETLVLQEVEPAVLNDREVRVAIHAAGLNFADILMTAGQYQVKPPLPFSPGMEMAGVVTEVGPGVTRVRKGDRVMSTCIHGGFAEERCISEDMVFPLPDEISFVTAAAFPITYGTVFHALTDRAALKSGEWLLVHAASSGVGLNAVELGKMMGAKVIACSSTDEKLQIIKGYGADELVNYTHESIRERVLAITDGRGADVIFDPVGGDVFDESLRCIAWEGRLLVVGFAAGRIQQIPANRVLLKECQIVGVNTSQFIKHKLEEYRDRFAMMLRWTAEGKLRPLISATYPLDQVARAMATVKARSATGKIVITTRSQGAEQ
ncbi:MAG: NADPH:quinone oxidoreductase family protein [Sulfuricaulis sp.]|nr:NADPH:quinone oxidoreductase family protein [Sulfuricaulis sp.]